ncbi:MAG: hypothetical protein M1358_15365, partial [Chloroflexi bacterium]|nr:hypothetical protein [Chloroflexota bacterium]
MNNTERLAYERELKRVAKGLGLPLWGNLEKTIIRHCQSLVAAWIAAHGQPKTLTDLLNLFAASLNTGFEEIRNDADLDELLRRIPPQREPGMARIHAELDDETDAVTIQRSHHEQWELPFLAVINCREWHAFRVYFTKNCFYLHRLLEGQQLRFAFRRTPVQRPEPAEVLVDRVAAALAFYPDIFEPVFREEMEKAGRLTFQVVDEIRQRLAPEASREATLIACLGRCPDPVWFVRGGMGFKRDEELRLTSRQARMSLFPNENPKPEPKLRVRAVTSSPATNDLGIRVHLNMQVPESSVVARAFQDASGLMQSGREPLEAWETSSGGPIGCGEVEVEAIRIDLEVWSL